MCWCVGVLVCWCAVLVRVKSRFLNALLYLKPNAEIIEKIERILYPSASLHALRHDIYFGELLNRGVSHDCANDGLLVSDAYHQRTLPQPQGQKRQNCQHSLLPNYRQWRGNVRLISERAPTCYYLWLSLHGRVEIRGILGRISRFLPAAKSRSAMTRRRFSGKMVLSKFKNNYSKFNGSGNISMLQWTWFLRRLSTFRL